MMLALPPQVPLTDIEQQTVQYYNRSAQEWVGTHKHDTTVLDEEMAAFNKILPEGALLEVGSGSGIDASVLLEYGYQYIGTDVSETLLQLAVERNKEKQAVFVKSSLYDLPAIFKPRYFDGFWAAAVFLHIPKNRLVDAFAGLKAVLKPGAVGFISLKKGEGEEIDSATGRLFSYFTTEEFTEIVKEQGFTVIQQFEKTYAKRETVFTWISFIVKYTQESKE